MSTDLRVVKTHKTIRNALVELLQHRDFDDIAVQDILDTALVNRSTFYKYYSGKGDLAGKMISDFKAGYAAALEQRFSCSDVALFYRETAPLIFQQRSLVLALWKVETRRHHLYQDMHDMLRQAFVRHAQLRKPDVADWSYQAVLFATLVLTSARYILENDRSALLAEAPDQWRQLVDMICT